MKPILFNTEMVQAILDGRKTVTRRVLKEPWYIEDDEVSRVSGLAMHRGIAATHMMPYPDQPYHPGNILYVRETWAAWSRTDGTAPTLHYKADGETLPGVKWHRSIHMPREAARIFLRVTDVRVERVQDIDDDGVVAEGLNIGDPFDELWDSTIKPADRALYGWDANPWVWVIEFERITREEAIPNA